LDLREEISNGNSLEEVTTKEATTLKVLKETSSKGEDGLINRHQVTTCEEEGSISSIELQEKMVIFHVIIPKNHTPSHQSKEEG